MKRIITVLLLSIFAMSCGQSYRSSYTYQCATQLTNNEIYDAQQNSLYDYSNDDLDLLADITTFIIDSNPEKDDYECFFNKRTKDLLILDVYGLEDEAKIDNTFCELIKNQNIELPQNVIILFHRYVNGYDDGGVIVGLANLVIAKSQ
jgi:hypothetical protein